MNADLILGLLENINEAKSNYAIIGRYEGVLAKLKTDCNFVGKSMKKMKEFSKENQTINQSIDNIKKKINGKRIKSVEVLGKLED